MQILAGVETTTKLVVCSGALANYTDRRGQSVVSGASIGGDQHGHVPDLGAVHSEEVVDLTAEIFGALVRVAKEVTSARSCLVRFF